MRLIGARRRVASGALLSLVATLGLTSCSDRPDLTAPVRVAIGEPQHLLPGSVDEADGAQVLSALFAPLVDLDPDGQPEPVAAEAVESSQDGKVWTITLRAGATFHDGEPVTTDNYLASWNYTAHQDNRQRNHFYFRRIAGYENVNPTGAEPSATTLAGLTRIDDRTFTVTLTAPFGEFASKLGAPAFYPLPSAAFDADGAIRPDFASAPIGNGPFQLVAPWQPGEPITVSRYESYVGQAPRIGGVEFVSYPDSAQQYAALRAGEVDLVTRISPEQVTAAASELGERYRQFPSAGFQFLAFPHHQPELADPAVRRAISMAIDRDAITTEVFHGTRRPAHGFVPPQVPGAQPDTCGDACRLDPVAARELYAQAGGPSELTITYNSDGGHEQWVAALCDQLHAHLAVECTAAAAPAFTDLVTMVEEEAEMGMVRLGWVMDYPSIASYLGPVFTTTGSANLHGYHNPTVDSWVATGAAAGDRDSALAAYQQAEALLVQDLPVIPLWFDQHTIGHASHIRSVTVNRWDRLDLTRLERLR